MAGLLVSVRSAAEARVALAGGASVIDIKEPERGALGRSDPCVWQDVVRAVDGATPVSVALGELLEWTSTEFAPAAWQGLDYRKVGLAGAGTTWRRDLTQLVAASPGTAAWIAVAYADWRLARAPSPDDVLDAALQTGCRGILVDTWDKSTSSLLDATWLDWIRRAKSRGLLVTLAGGLDEVAICRLAHLEPDLFAVRGAACTGGDRHQNIDLARVAHLAAIIGERSSHAPWPVGRTVEL